MLDDSNIHPFSPGKSILIICCSEGCIEHQRRDVARRLWPAPVNAPTRYTLECQGDTIQLMLVRWVETQGRSQKFDDIYTCGCVFIPERLMHMLRVRLKNPADWLGYFSKFP